MSLGIGLNENYNNWPKAIGNHGNMPPIYTYMQEKKYKVIGDKCVEVHSMKTSTAIWGS